MKSASSARRPIADAQVAGPSLVGRGRCPSVMLMLARVEGLVAVPTQVRSRDLQARICGRCSASPVQNPSVGKTGRLSPVRKLYAVTQQRGLRRRQQALADRPAAPSPSADHGNEDILQMHTMSIFTLQCSSSCVPARDGGREHGDIVEVSAAGQYKSTQYAFGHLLCDNCDLSSHRIPARWSSWPSARADHTCPALYMHKLRATVAKQQPSPRVRGAGEAACTRCLLVSMEQPSH